MTSFFSLLSASQAVIVTSVLVTNYFDTTMQGRPDAMQRSAVVTESHVYRFKDKAYTNCVSVTTNTTQLRLQWVELPVTQELQSGCVTKLWLIGTEVVHGSDSNTAAFKPRRVLTPAEAKAIGLPLPPKK